MGGHSPSRYAPDQVRHQTPHLFSEAPEGGLKAADLLCTPPGRPQSLRERPDNPRHLGPVDVYTAVYTGADCA